MYVYIYIYIYIYIFGEPSAGSVRAEITVKSPGGDQQVAIIISNYYY